MPAAVDDGGGCLDLIGPAASQDLPAAALAGSEDRFQLLMDAVIDYAICMLDPEGCVVTWNAGAERTLGYTADQIQGRCFSIFYLPEEAQAGAPRRALAIAASEGRYAAEGWRLRKDGSRFWAQATLTAMRGTRGELRGFAKVTRDMTAQKAVEEANRSRNTQQELNRIILENVSEYVIFSMDAQGRITSWNSGAERASGAPAEQMLGRHFSIFFSEQDVAEGVPEDELAEAALNGQVAVDGWRYTPSRQRLWSSSVLSSVRDEAGVLTGFVRVARVMTKQKEAEDGLRRLNEQLQRYRMIVENIDEYAIYTLDLEGRITSWEAGAQKMTGATQEQMLGRHFSLFFSAEDIAAGEPQSELREAARTGRHIADAWRLTPMGERVWSSAVINALRDERGQLTGYLRMARILTDRKHVEDSLRALNGQLERYRVIVENINDHMIFTLDRDGRFDSWSPGATRLLGYTEAEALGQDYSLIFTEEDRDTGLPRQQLKQAADTGHCMSEGWRVRKGGERFWSIGETTAIKDSAGKVGCYVRVARDMTRQKRAEEALAQLASDLEVRVAERTRQLESTVDELRRKNEEVEALASMTARDLEEKRVMLNEIHHRVKNNLQVVQSLLKMSVRSLPEGDARTVTMATAQRVFAMAMVHERLYQTKDLAGISAANYLRDLFAGVAESNVALHGQVKVELDCDEILLNLDHAIPFGLLVNELLSNCLKHAFPEGRRGTVTVSIRRMPGGVKIAFKDDGVGLREGFDPAKCTSMGLKLASSLARQLGGTLKFSSDHGCRVETSLTRI